MHNKNLQIWFIFNFFTKAGGSIASNMTQVYLTNDLNFPKETLAMIKVVGMPLNILFAFISGYLSSEKPFIVQSYNLLAIIAISVYTVNVLLQYFPDENNITQATVIHVSITIFI